MKKILYILFVIWQFSLTAQTKKPLNVVWISCEDMGPLLGAWNSKYQNT